MSDQNLFLEATRKKYRFQSERGELNVEQLWEIPLTSRNGFNLNAIAILVNNELKSLTEESFVETKSDPNRSILQGKLDVLKAIIAIRQAESKAAADKFAADALKKRLKDAIAAKEEEELLSGSVEDLRAQLAALG